jgi:copper chaperone
MATADIKIEGMSCEACVKSVTRALQAVPGVQKVQVLLEEGEANVTYDPAKAGVAELKDAVLRAGYEVP